MKIVIGIDAAWTARNPSGVALIIDDDEGWKLVCVESSYTEFVDRDPALPSPPTRPTGSIADAKLLLKAASDLAGCWVDVEAIDMPLSRSPSPAGGYRIISFRQPGVRGIAGPTRRAPSDLARSAMTSGEHSRRSGYPRRSRLA